MAIEATKMAAATYQGRTSNVAKPVKARDSDTDTAKTDNDSSMRSLETGSVKPIQPVTEDFSEDKGDVLGNSNNQQTSKQLQQAVEKLRKNMMAHTEAVFGIHEGTNRVMIKIVDKESKDIIKEYPPEQTLDMIQKVWEMAGIMVDEKG